MDVSGVVELIGMTFSWPQWERPMSVQSMPRLRMWFMRRSLLDASVGEMGFMPTTCFARWRVWARLMGRRESSLLRIGHGQGVVGGPSWMGLEREWE